MEQVSKQTSEICIRIARPADADLLVELGRASFFEAFSEQTDPRDMEYHLQNAFKVDEIRKQVDNDQTLFLIVEVNSIVAGYAYLNPGTPPGCLRSPKPIQLVRFYLRKKYYGRNVGNALMQACLERALSRGFQSVWLSTWELNHRANAFYKKWGFEIAGRAKFTVGRDVQNDFIFARSI